MPSERDNEIERIAALGFDWVLSSPDVEGGISALAKALNRDDLRMIVQVTREQLEILPRCIQDGARGFIFTTAVATSTETWRKLLAEIRAARPDLLLIAEAFGRPQRDAIALTEAGFDWILDNFAWWDLRDSWYLDEARSLGRHARRIATLEPWLGLRLRDKFGAIDPAQISRIFAGRYAIATVAASGLLCARGYEFGEGSEPSGALFNISAEIARLNRLKSEHPALATNAPPQRASAPDAPVLALARSAPEGGGVIALYNMSTAPADQPTAFEVAVATGRGVRLADAFTGERAELSTRKLHGLETLVLTSRSVQIAARERAPEPRIKKRDILARQRIAIENISPSLDGGRFPVKRVLGDRLRVEADIFMDGHEVLVAALKTRLFGTPDWRETPMVFLDNDRWGAETTLDQIGRLEFVVEAWRDLWGTWRAGIVKKHEAGQKISLELKEGVTLLKRYADAAQNELKAQLHALLKETANAPQEAEKYALLTADEAKHATEAAGLRDSCTASAPLDVVIDPPHAAVAAWFEIFPRSMSDDESQHGTFDDVIAKLPYMKELGFDVLYFPPIHPIGKTNRKGRNNSLTPAPGDPGSPYAIGSPEGGHDAIHRELGSFDDFRRLIEAAKRQNIEIALDFAIQCSPDHPWIKEHPEWFDWRPDGTIKFAENPPKKYEDIVNVHFYRDAYPSIWIALRDVVLFWIQHGVTIFRVDNPHTKPLPFWEWMIADVKVKHPEAVFLSEAFTRPKMMKRLAKVGFTQSYSYFTWRNTKRELMEYLTELTQTDAREFMRPNFFVNTPDINPIPLQTSGRAGFQTRLVLAATLSPLYGVYNGFELCEATPVPGKEEYLDSEKYQLKAWDRHRPGNIREDVARINRIRRDNPALWRFDNLLFLNAWNDNILVYAKLTEDRDNVVLVAVNLDPHNAHGAHFEAPLWEFGLPDNAAVQAVDLVRGGKSFWQGKVQHVWLDPADNPYGIWRLIPPGGP